PSGLITVELRDSAGNPVQAGAGGVTLGLSNGFSGTGAFLDASGHLLPVPAVTIAAGSGTASFEYQDTRAGTTTLAVSGPGLLATQQETIQPGPATGLGFPLFLQPLALGQPSAPISVGLRDQYFNAVPAGPGGLTLSLSSTSAGGAFLDTTGQPL